MLQVSPYAQEDYKIQNRKKPCFAVFTFVTPEDPDYKIVFPIYSDPPLVQTTERRLRFSKADCLDKISLVGL